MTWRGAMRLRYNGNTYPTHSLGPVAQWLGVNKEGGDRLARTATWMTPAKAVSSYVRDRFGSDHPAARDDFWAHGDSATTIVQTEKGVVIVLRMDSNSPRPHNMTHYALQGIRAAYVSARHAREDPLIWIDGKSPGQSPGDAEWEPLWRYSYQYEHPSWREWGEQARQAGHGGADLLVLKDFLDAVQTGTNPPIDVYDAVTWSSIMPLSIESVARGSIPLEIPDFRSNQRAHLNLGAGPD